MTARNKEGYPDPTASEALRREKARARGALNRAEGQRFESRIEAACRYYRTAGLALIKKTPEPVKILSKINTRGQFNACYERKADPDYQGTLKGGRSVVFEAKYTSGDRITTSRLTQEQINALEFHWSMGAAAFVLIGIQQEYFRVPWEVWRKLPKGHQYMDCYDAAPFRVKESGGIIRFLE